MRDRTLARLLVLPCALAILILGIFPLIYALHLSFHSWQLPSLEPQFVGLENYANILQDKRFYWAIVRSCFFVVTTVGIQFLLGFTGAFVLSRGVRGLHLAVMGSGIVVTQGASLVRKDVNVMVDDGAVPG